MTLQELKKQIENLRKLSIDPSPLIAEYQRRLAWSLSPLIFILLGFPFAATTHRRASLPTFYMPYYSPPLTTFYHWPARAWPLKMS